MKVFAIAAFAICLPVAAQAQQTQPPASSPKPQEPFTPGLGEIIALPTRAWLIAARAAE